MCDEASEYSPLDHLNQNSHTQLAGQDQIQLQIMLLITHTVKESQDNWGKNQSLNGTFRKSPSVGLSEG